MIDCRLSGELPRVPKKRLSRLSLSPLPPEQDSPEDSGDATLPMADSGMIRAHKQPSEPADDPTSPETQAAAKYASVLPPQGMAWGPSIAWTPSEGCFVFTITAVHMFAPDLVISLCLCQLNSWPVCLSVCLCAYPYMVVYAYWVPYALPSLGRDTV